MSQPMRVLHVIGKMDRGGAETMIMNLYREIDRSKVQFDFVVHTDQKCAYDDEIIALGGKIYSLPPFNGINILKYQKAWENFLSKHSEYKIIHGHLGSTAAIYLNVAKKYSLYTIAHSHNTNNKVTLKGKLYSIFTYPTRNIAHYFFGCSKAAGIDRFGNGVVNSSNFQILDNAIKTEEFIYSIHTREMKRIEFNLNEKFVIGHIGRFNIQKNHAFLIEVFKKIHDEHSNAVLMLIGDGNLREDIELKVNKLGLKDNVIFTGVRSDIPDLMQAMDVFVFPSLFEGLGIVTVEAQAAGLKCIVSDAIPEEAYLTNLVEVLSLKSPIEIWTEKILEYIDGYERTNTYQEIKRKGYDINDTVIWLQEFYLKERNYLC